MKLKGCLSKEMKQMRKELRSKKKKKVFSGLSHKTEKKYKGKCRKRNGYNVYLH